MLVNQGRYDVASNFSDPQASAQALKPNATFLKPRNYDEQMQQVKRVLNVQFQ